MFSSAKHPVLTGTAILTCAGILSRLIGFFYRIFLSRTIGAQGLGIYQMIFPVYAFCLSGVTAGIQSALSRCCSAALSKGNPRKGWVFFLSGSGLSVGLSLIVSFFLYTRAPWISLHILHEIRCCELLQLLAFSLPLCSIHTCIHAWYFSTRRTTVPAVSQLLEQFARVGASYVIYLIFLEQNLAPTPILAVGGMLFGELAACFFCVVCLAFQKPSYKGTTDFRVRSCLWEILTLSVPLTLNRMLVNLLQSTEAILIPGKLEASGLTNAQSLSLYGALTGMALPFILFPSAITSALSTMLLPTIAGQQAAGKEDAIIRSTEQTIQYCLWLGFLSGGIFFFFGKELAQIFYRNPGRQHLFTDPGIPLSFPLSHRHSDRDPERPGTHRPMPDPKPRRPWNPNPLRLLRNPPPGNPRLPLRSPPEPTGNHRTEPALFTKKREIPISRNKMDHPALLWNDTWMWMRPVYLPHIM